MGSDGNPSRQSGREAAVRFRPELSARPGDGSLNRTEVLKDELVRRWDVVTPAATRIGRASSPGEDLSATIRRLHDEQHPAMQGHAARMHRLDKARITQAFCNSLGVTRWERDRALGIVTELDLTAFGQHRSVSKIALVVIQYVVDDERRRQLGLHDTAWVRDHDEATLETLYGRYESIKDDPRYQELMDAEGLDKTTVNRLTRILQEQLQERSLEGAVLGRSPFRDAHLPAIREAPGSTGE